MLGFLGLHLNWGYSQSHLLGDCPKELLKLPVKFSYASRNIAALGRMEESCSNIKDSIRRSVVRKQRKIQSWWVKYKVEGGVKGTMHAKPTVPCLLRYPLNLITMALSPTSLSFIITLPNLLPSTHFSLRHRDQACIAILQSPIPTEFLIPIFSH